MCTQCSVIASESERPETLDVEERRQRPTLCLDIGRVRIGVALSSAAADMAIPHSVLQRKGTRRDARLLIDLMDRQKIQVVVIGLPPQSSEKQHCSARLARLFAAHVASNQARPVWLVDEAESTAEATAELRLLGMRSGRRRRIIDKIAAARILDRYLGGDPVFRVLPPARS